MVAGSCVLTCAELLQISVSWTVSYTISPPEWLNSYLSAFSLGRSAARLVVGPAVVAAAPGTLGSAVWLLLAGLFAVALVAVLVILKRT